MENSDPTHRRLEINRGLSSKGRSCAECQRSKSKCDREVNIPCSNCVKRGCAPICPNGRRMKIGQSTIVEGTEALHFKIDELTQRIQELEEALGALQAQLSNEPHPLLKKLEEAPLISTGSLVIKGDGKAAFYGASSSVEWLMTMEEETSSGVSPPDGRNTTVPNLLRDDLEIESISSGLPLFVGRIDKDEMLELAISKLPARELASMLVNCYYSRSGWLVSPIPRDRFLSDHFEPCYNYTPHACASLQDFSLVYAVFALGMTNYAEFPNYIEIANGYNSMARACLASGDFVTSSSLSVIEALFLCTAFHHLQDGPHDMDKGWVLLGVAFRQALAMGLHREPSIWGLSAEECARRRRTMWDMVSYDLWGALITGRPPMISRQHFDVMIPSDGPDSADSNPNFIRMRHHFNQNCFWQIIDFILSPSSQATYSEALKLDTKIRNSRLPNSSKTISLRPFEEDRTNANFRGAILSVCREIALLCLHRPYFACALLEPPFDPLGPRSTFARSVLACYASARTILDGIRALHSKEPVAMLRFGFFWTYSFSAAVILSSIVIRAPDCMLAYAASIEFDRAVDLFQRAQSGPRVRRVLPVLLRLQTKARASFDSHLAGTWTKPTSTDSQLHQGLSASVLVDHSEVFSQVRSNEAQEPGPQIDLMTSLGIAQSSPSSYVGSLSNPTGHQGSNILVGRADNSGHGPGTTGNSPANSDAFLNQILAGQWNVYPQPGINSEVPFTSDSGFLQASDTPLEAMAPSYLRSNLNTPSYNARRDPSSDVSFASVPAFTSMGGPTGISRYGDLEQSSNSHITHAPMATASAEKTEIALVWNDFLRDLGV